jgi:adenylate cyclase
VRLKGKDHPARVHELIGDREAAPAAPVDVDRFAAALACYRRRDWDGAEGAFSALLAAAPGDGPSRVFLDRVRALRGAALPVDWDGVYEQVSK